MTTMNESTEAIRLKNFKKVVDSDEGRRRREETRISIRRVKKNDRLAKRRYLRPVVNVPESNPGINTSIADLVRFVKCVSNPGGALEEIFEGVHGIRKMLSVNKNPPIKEVIEAGVLRNLVDLLMRTDAPKIQFEAAWALTNIASSEFTSSLANIPEAIGSLSKLLLSVSPDIREQCAWCLANIAGDCTEYRDEVLRHGALKSLIKNIENPANESLLGTVVWAISNLCRGKPTPKLSLISEVIGPLHRVIQSSNVDDVLIDALWALSYISDGTDDRIDSVLELGEHFTKSLVNILKGDQFKLMAPALRILGNFASGSEMQTQAVIDAGIIDIALTVLNNPKKSLRKEMCWLLSNVSAGSRQQINSLLKVPKVAEKLIEFSMEADWETRKEAVWAVSNACTGGSENQVMSMVEQNAIEAMVSVLDLNDSRLVVVGLEAINKILAISERQGQAYNVILDEHGGLDKIEELQNHGDHDVYQKAVEIIERFFGGELENEDENIAPSLHDNAFSFGMSPPPSKNLFNESISNNNAFTFGQQNINQMSCDN